MIETSVEGLARKPLSAVFSYIWNLESMTEYNSSVKHSRRISDSDTGLPVFEISVGFELFQLKNLYKVESFEKDRFFSAYCESSAVYFKDFYEFTEQADGTYIRISDRMELKGLLKLAEPVVRNNMKHQMQENMNRLLQILNQ